MNPYSRMTSILTESKNPDGLDSIFVNSNFREEIKSITFEPDEDGSQYLFPAYHVHYKSISCLQWKHFRDIVNFITTHLRKFDINLKMCEPHHFRVYDIMAISMSDNLITPRSPDQTLCPHRLIMSGNGKGSNLFKKGINYDSVSKLDGDILSCWMTNEFNKHGFLEITTDSYKLDPWVAFNTKSKNQIDVIFTLHFYGKAL